MIVEIDRFFCGSPGVYAAATGSTRLESLFLTLPTRGLTGQHVVSFDGQGANDL